MLDPGSGVEMKVKDGKAFGRRGYGEWQETGSVTEWMAPEGDFLAFLTVARKVRNQGADLRGGIGFTRFTFEVDGPALGPMCGTEMAARMTAQGELPPGAQLGLPETYAKMTGSGELWVIRDGLPRARCCIWPCRGKMITGFKPTFTTFPVLIANNWPPWRRLSPFHPCSSPWVP